MASVSPFQTNVDISNLALQLLGVRRIAALNDATAQAAECNFCYDKLRLSELRASPWRFAARRVNLRQLATNTNRIVPPVWATGTSYGAGAIVQDANGVYWISNFAANSGNTPGVATAGQESWWQQYFGPVVSTQWSSTVTYDAGEIVFKSGAATVLYVNTVNASVNQDPAGGNGWLSAGTVTNQATLNLYGPYGPAKTVANRARNLFRLPNGFLRLLPPDPKVESTEQLETSAAIRYGDYQLEDRFIVSNAADPILIRFVADVSDVPSMEPMFCTLLAHRMALHMCERLTQSNIKLQAVAAAYQRFSRDARRINWLEIGSTEPEEEEYELTKGPQGVAESPTAGPPGEAARPT